MGVLKPEERTYVDNTRFRIEEQARTVYIGYPDGKTSGERSWLIHDKCSQEHCCGKKESRRLGLERFGMVRLICLVFKGDMLNQLREMAETESLRDGLLSMELLAPQSRVPSQQLTRRYIPWLDGWSISVVAQDVSSLGSTIGAAQTTEAQFDWVCCSRHVFGAILSTRVTVSELVRQTLISICSFSFS